MKFAAPIAKPGLSTFHVPFIMLVAHLGLIVTNTSVLPMATPLDTPHPTESLWDSLEFWLTDICYHWCNWLNKLFVWHPPHWRVIPTSLKVIAVCHHWSNVLVMDSNLWIMVKGYKSMSYSFARAAETRAGVHWSHDQSNILACIF